MALALILAIQPGPEGVAVRFDIGHNRYLRWSLGEGESETANGLPRLTGAAGRSSLIGPLRPEARGHGEFVIPRAMLSREKRALQITSYRDDNGAGPAISAVETLPVSLLSDLGGEPPPPAGLALGATQASKKDSIMTAVSPAYQRQTAMARQVDNAPFHLRERRLSRPMFIDAIVGALPSLLPMLAPAIGSLLASVAPAVGQVAGQVVRSVSGGGAPRADAGTQTAVAQIANLAEQALRAAGPASQQILTPENMRQIMQLIQAGAAAQGGATARASGLSRRGPRRRHLSLARSQYSQAQVAPALLAALPALMPLLQQVLSPQTVQSIIDAPQRMTGQIINGITDFARLGLQADQQLQEHLRALNPGVDDPALHQLLAGLSLGMTARRGRAYKRVSSVRLMLDHTPTQVVFGREVSLYQQGAPLQFPLSVETPQSIRDAELMLQIKQADDLRIVHEDAEPIGDVSSGPLEIIPRVEADVSARLSPQKDYIVVLSLIWRNSKGQSRGTSVQHSISLMGDYRFDRVEETGELIPLSDRETYRDYWHRLWEAPFDSDTRRVDIQSRYFLTLNPERNRNARLDSDVRTEQEGPRATIRLRSGYEYSLYALNHLMTRLEPDQEALSDAALEALNGADFVERFNQAAQHQGQIRGRPGESAALWAFPVFKMQTLVMVRAENVDENGVIGGLSEERIRFPMPAMVHFVGVKQA
ncbi:hypothetical protein ONV78_25160 [Hahella sp. CR1]|uniref:hypothetical protein n=1 Tax=Hahella sp. CR1 TaxID=2992807 RepID=UPI002442DD12|nr:hypothetical protein [Hahella sp. CR1]MDG9671055.1 hypothetical protein [Hahella sp. CR1]